MSACSSRIGWLQPTMLLLMLSLVGTCKGSRRMSTNTFPEVSVWQGVVSQTPRDRIVFIYGQQACCFQPEHLAVVSKRWVHFCYLYDLSLQVARGTPDRGALWPALSFILQATNLLKFYYYHLPVGRLTTTWHWAFTVFFLYSSARSFILCLRYYVLISSLTIYLWEA